MLFFYCVLVFVLGQTKQIGPCRGITRISRLRLRVVTPTSRPRYQEETATSRPRYQGEIATSLRHLQWLATRTGRQRVTSTAGARISRPPFRITRPTRTSLPGNPAVETVTNLPPCTLRRVSITEETRTSPRKCRLRTCRQRLPKTTERMNF